ncbi:MAG TPA: hypothetical protein VJS66_00065 [Burkholderiales bacterium]|nr:hypothetical protein [Burkholderiales bacterium]
MSNYQRAEDLKLAPELIALAPREANRRTHRRDTSGEVPGVDIHRRRARTQRGRNKDRLRDFLPRRAGVTPI